MTFAESQEFVMPFGKYKGRKLDDIATDDEGLKYLDWAIGNATLMGRTKDALTTFLADASIQKELSRII